jgi:hypothetical protein
VTIKEREKFKEAIRAKLLLEVAGRTPKHRVGPVAEKGASHQLRDWRKNVPDARFDRADDNRETPLFDFPRSSGLQARRPSGERTRTS